MKLSIKDKIQKEIENKINLDESKIYNKLSDLFFESRDKRKRKDSRRGLHASNLIQTKKITCFRQKVLSLIYEPDDHEINSPRLLRIYKHGDVIHSKWQNMFLESNISTMIEKRCYSEKYSLYFTPDAVVNIDGKLHVVEIKSMKSTRYMKNEVPSTSRRQITLYMFLLGIKRGFILQENKDNQDFRVIPVEYKAKDIIPVLENLYKIINMKKEFDNSNQLPCRVCDWNDIPRAKRCHMRSACWENRGDIIEKI